jgi:hypothetical protein
MHCWRPSLGLLIKLESYREVSKISLGHVDQYCVRMGDLQVSQLEKKRFVKYTFLFAENTNFLCYSDIICQIMHLRCY